ncbi:MAG: signal peptidase II, partial [Caldimicrobium sp.]
MKLFFLSATFLFLLDRITKYLALKSPYEVIEILPFLNLVKAWNKGIAFGFFHNSLEVFSLLLLVLTPMILIFLFIFAKNADNINRILFGAIFGGGLGNWIDRLSFGAVFDFIDLHIGNLHWPA